MRAIRIGPHDISVIDAPNSIDEMQTATARKLEKIPLYDGAVMIVDSDALHDCKPYNNLAALIARCGVYGDALIAGDNGEQICDVPDKFLALLDYPEFYFRDE